MTIKLIPFDDSCPFHVEGQFQETPETLIFKWSPSSTDKLVLPPHSEQNRVIGLWESTCFEVFLKNIKNGHYLEFNFSPSTDWNAFTFETYRSELKELPFSAPSMNFDGKSFEVILLKSQIPDEFNEPGHRAHWMTSVLKFEDGSIHYLAPSHPEDAPDFHNIGEQFIF